MFKTGLLGYPIEHSLSPLIHNAGFEYLKLPYHYDLYPCKQAKFSVQVNAYGSEFKGFSVTMPDKQAALHFCEEKVSAAAANIGAVNTLYKDSNNNWWGENTDYVGVKQVILENFLISTPEIVDSPAIIAGNGGSALAVLYALGALGFKNVVVLVRAVERAAKLVDLAALLGLNLNVLEFGSEPSLMAIERSGLLINTLPIDFGEVNFKKLAVAKNIFDILYYPRPTPLEFWGKTFGNKVVNGIDLLLYQGTAQFQLFTGVSAPVEIMRDALYQAC